MSVEKITQSTEELSQQAIAQPPTDLSSIHGLDSQSLSLAEKNSTAILEAQDQIQILNMRLDQLSKQYSTLNERYLELNATTKATADFSDDLVSSSSLLISTVEDRVDKTLTQAGLVLDHADSLLSTYLVIISIAIAILGFWLQRSLAKTREEHLQDAVKDLTTKLNKDRDFREEFTYALVNHRDLRQNINTSIDAAIKERVTNFSQDDLSEFQSYLDTGKDS